MGRCSRPSCKFSHGDAGGGGSGGPGGGGGYGGSYGGSAREEEPSGPPAQCDAKCVERGCDNARIYITGLSPDVTTDELHVRVGSLWPAALRTALIPSSSLQALFSGIGIVGRIRQKRGYKDQWPYNIKLYTDDSGKCKGDASLTYEVRLPPVLGYVEA